MSAFDPKHLRPSQMVRGEIVDWIAWLRRDDRPGQCEHGKCIAYFEKLEVAYATEREMHNAWRKRAEEAEAVLLGIADGEQCDAIRKASAYVYGSVERGPQEHGTGDPQRHPGRPT